MHSPLRHNDGGFRRNVVAPKFGSVNGVAGHRPDGRVQAHRFQQNPFHIAQIGAVVRFRQSVAENRVEFRRKFSVGGGVLRKQMKNEGQGERGGFVSGKVHRQRFVAQLLIVHSSSIVLITDLQQKVKQVAGTLAAAPPFPDDVVDDRVHNADSAAQLAVRGGGDSVVKFDGLPHPLHDAFLRVMEGAFHPFGLRVARSRAEQSPRHDLQREAHHVGVDVAGFAVPPGFAHRVGAIGHNFAVGGDAFAVEGGLRQFALPPPEIAFADEQAVPEQHPIAPQQVAFGEFAVIGHEGLLNQIGGMDGEGADGAEA